MIRALLWLYDANGRRSEIVDGSGPKAAHGASPGGRSRRDFLHTTVTAAAAASVAALFPGCSNPVPENDFSPIVKKGLLSSAADIRIVLKARLEKLAADKELPADIRMPAGVCIRTDLEAEPLRRLYGELVKHAASDHKHLKETALFNIMRFTLFLAEKYNPMHFTSEGILGAVRLRCGVNKETKKEISKEEQELVQELYELAKRAQWSISLLSQMNGAVAISELEDILCLSDGRLYNTDPNEILRSNPQPNPVQREKLARQQDAVNKQYLFSNGGMITQLLGFQPPPPPPKK